ncbi:NU6M oxidoreductase, partial [Crypturellus undulatus]|nr:NU6M oxidoreductase [Crypturellus undulatus]
MTYLVFFGGICFVLGVLAVVSNPSAYSGPLRLMVGSVVGCGWLVSLGASFISLALFSVYLGEMSVVFVYSVSLTADPYPETWGHLWVLGYGVGFV